MLLDKGQFFDNYCLINSNLLLVSGVPDIWISLNLKSEGKPLAFDLKFLRE